jgi:hypothetical protein
MEDDMKRSYNRTALVAVCLLLFPAMARAQANDEPPIINPEAMDALRKMGEYLRTLQKFQIAGVITTEHVLADSQKIQVTKQVDLVASRPNNLRALIKSDKFERQLIYDGTTFTLFAPRKKMYASVPAPPTINELATMIEEKHAIELPLVDMFRWGTAEESIKDITAAKDVGESVCENVTCQHYAFRQPGLDWEIWIQKGDYPLPRRVVLTTRTDEARPQHTATYSWNLAPSFNAESFAFVAPKDAQKITLADLTAAKTTAKGNQE